MSESKKVVTAVNDASTNAWDIIGCRSGFFFAKTMQQARVLAESNQGVLLMKGRKRKAARIR